MCQTPEQISSPLVHLFLTSAFLGEKLTISLCLDHMSLGSHHSSTKNWAASESNSTMMTKKWSKGNSWIQDHSSTIVTKAIVTTTTTCWSIGIAFGMGMDRYKFKNEWFVDNHINHIKLHFPFPLYSMSLVIYGIHCASCTNINEHIPFHLIQANCYFC
jgi:hypothetical protein